MKKLLWISWVGVLLFAGGAVADVDLTTADASAPAGSAVVIPVTFSANGDDISTVVLRALYDETSLTPLLVRRGAVAAAAGKAVAFNASGGLLNVSVSGGDTVIADGPLVEIVLVSSALATVDVPVGVSDAGSDAATPEAVLIDAVLEGFTVTPLASAGQHSADSDLDWRISLSELLRIIQFFNSDSYHCEPGTEDDFAPGLGAQDCSPHDSDYAAQDWSINLSELLRAIQFYNTTQGYYHTDGGGEDGFAPGPFPAS